MHIIIVFQSVRVRGDHELSTVLQSLWEPLSIASQFLEEYFFSKQIIILIK